MTIAAVDDCSVVMPPFWHEKVKPQSATRPPVGEPTGWIIMRERERMQKIERVKVVAYSRRSRQTATFRSTEEHHRHAGLSCVCMVPSILVLNRECCHLPNRCIFSAARREMMPPWKIDVNLRCRKCCYAATRISAGFHQSFRCDSFS